MKLQGGSGGGERAGRAEGDPGNEPGWGHGRGGGESTERGVAGKRLWSGPGGGARKAL